MSAYGDERPLGERRLHPSDRPSPGGHRQPVPMARAIPGRQRREEPPPPLPPPRHVDVDMNNSGAGSQSPHWRWDSDGSFGRSRDSAPSSAHEDFPKTWARSGNKASGNPTVSDNRRRQSDNETLRFGKDPRYDASTRFDEGYHSMSVGLPSMSSQSVLFSSS